MGAARSTFEDEHEIAKLSLEYARGADTRDGELFASVFTADGVLSYNGRESKGHELLAKIPRGLNRYVKTYHTVYNTRIALNGDTARGEIYSASHHLSPLDGAAHSDKVMYITYHDDYVRTAEGWRIHLRKVIVEFLDFRTVQMAELPQD